MWWLSLIQSGLNLNGSALAGGAQKKALYQQSYEERADAKLQAKKIRDLARATRSTAEADTAASGVDVGSGSPVEVQRDIARRSEEDALNTILGGERRAKALKKAGKSAFTSSVLSGIGGSASSGMGGWLSK